MRRPALYGTLIIALSALPLFFLEGVAGAFFPSIAVAYLAALAASMVVALTLTPARGLLLLSNEPAERASPRSSYAFSMATKACPRASSAYRSRRSSPSARSWSPLP